MADQTHCLPQKWTHKVSNISRYVLLTSQSYRFPRHHCLASDINLCCRVWLCIRSSISWCCGAGQTDQALTNSLHIALRRTDCIASCILLHFVDQIILQEERITLWVALHWIVTIHPRWQIRSVQMTAWQESSICSNHHFALNHQIGTQLSDRHPNYQRYYHAPTDGQPTTQSTSPSNYRWWANFQGSPFTKCQIGSSSSQDQNVLSIRLSTAAYKLSGNMVRDCLNLNYFSIFHFYKLN